MGSICLIYKKTDQTTLHHTMTDLLKYSAQNYTKVHRKTPLFVWHYHSFLFALSLIWIIAAIKFCHHHMPTELRQQDIILVKISVTMAANEFQEFSYPKEGRHSNEKAQMSDIHSKRGRWITFPFITGSLICLSFITL